MSLNCLQVLSDYAGFLNAIPTTLQGDPLVPTIIEGVRPHPLFFSGLNCTGRMWPDREHEPLDSVDILNPASTPYAFGSMYVPPGWSVQLTDMEGHVGSYPKESSGLPILIADTSTTLIGTGAVFFIRDRIAKARIFLPRVLDAIYSIHQWKLDMCMNTISTVVGAQHLLSWHGGSQECDDFMTIFCEPVSAFTCLPNSTEIAPLNDPYQPCVCLVEQNCIRDTFCQPGSPIEVCPEPTKLAAYVPVSCYGKQCSVSGYRWGFMQRQPCNITLCQQIINLVGNDIVRKGGSTLWCGNQAISAANGSLTPTPTTTIPDFNANPDTGIQLETWTWILIGIAVFAFAIALPLAIIVYRQAGKRNAKMPSHQVDAQPSSENSLRLDSNP